MCPWSTDTVPSGSYGYYLSGEHWEVIDSSSGTFTVTSPGMSASASGHQGMGSAGINFYVDINWPA